MASRLAATINPSQQLFFSVEKFDGRRWAAAVDYVLRATVAISRVHHLRAAHVKRLVQSTALPQCPTGHLRKPQRPREQESVVPEPLDSLVPLAQHFWVVEISQQQLSKSVGILV
jgi:hypothetical protein